MSKLINNKRFQQRVLYTLCFFALCIIDWIKGSLNGRAQMTATNITGIIIAVIVFSSINIRKFIKPVFVVWLVICAIAIPISVRMILAVYPYKGQVITAAINIVLHGILLIWTLTSLIENKKFNGVRIFVFIAWLSMLLLMLFSVNENIWPIWYATIFGILYLTDFDRRKEMDFLQSIPDGIILGFFIIQGGALLFRPFDTIRYSGLYINPNINALFYLMSYSAFLCKWYILKKNEKTHVFRAIVFLFAASMFGFCVFAGSRSALLAMLVVTVPFSLLMIKNCKKKILSFVGCWLALGLVGVISVPIVYLAIRYMPTIHLHPLYFEGEYSIYKVQPGESRDSEKYISFENAMEVNMGRVFYKIPKLKEYVDSVFTLQVHAAEPEKFQEIEYLFNYEEVAEGIDPVDLRQRIYRYYFKRLNMTGHTNDYEGAPVDPNYTAPHAHNAFIQMAFLYGIPAGLLFLLMTMSFVPGSISLMKAGEDIRVCLIACFVLAFAVFGFFEVDWLCGQLPFTMFFLLFRDVVRKPYNV